ncbi:MAG TPA: PAS domain S-box protein [Rubrobacter sp.]|nr:PAS domain S-box protein [Rubrobacter sp.]
MREARPRKASATRTLRVLLVEDSENDAMLLLRELRRGGYEPVFERVHTPEGMEEAWRLAEAGGRPFQIVISDYFLPRFGAAAALELSRKLAPDVPFIVVSGKVGEEAAVGIMKAGADDYLAKEDMSRLCPAIERELREAEVKRERELALTRSEDRFKRLVEQAADAIFVHDLEGRLVDVNRQACVSLGYTREELLGMSVADVETSFRAGSLGKLWKQISSGTPLTLEGAHRRKDGTTFPVEIRVGLFEADERPLMLALVRDVSGRREAEEKIRETEARYRTLVERIPAVTYVQEPLESDNPKAITYMSPQYEAMLGYPADAEIVDEEHWLKTLHPEDRARVLAEEVRTDETGEPYRVEYRQIARDGSVVWVRDEADLLRDGDGRPLYWLGVQYDITEQKRTEQELRESEERFRATFEQAAVGILQVGLDGGWLRFNDKFCDITGYPREELGAASVFSLIGPEDFDRDFERGLSMLAGELRDYSEEKLIIGKGGVRVWIDLTVSLVYDENDEPIYFIAVVEDIGKRKEAEEGLRQSEERFRMLSEEVVEGLVLSENGRIIDANRSLTEMFGYELAELVGIEAGDLTPPDRREMVRRRIEREDTSYYESRGQKKDGTVFPIEIRSRKLPYSGRRIRVTSVIDLTERKRQEEALRQSEALYRTVVEQAAENIFLVDARTRRVLEANDALLHSLGYTEDELKRMTLYDIVAHERESVDLNIGRVMEEGRASLGERRYRRKDGTLADVEVNVSAVPYDGRRVLCVVAHDVTQRKRAEAMLEEIREAERNRIARELHDGTLQDIVYALQELQVMQVMAGDGGNPSLENTVDALRRSVEGLRSAIFELRLEGTLDRSIVTSLENLIDLNRRMARERYDIELVVGDDFPDDLPEMAGQEITRLVQEALTNIRRHAVASHARVELGTDGGLAFVEVSDDGRGFDPNEEGTGIGRQSMGQRALELGGGLDLQSAPGEGTTVRLLVPLSRLMKE